MDSLGFVEEQVRGFAGSIQYSVSFVTPTAPGDAAA
jgi:hypothetical protein